MWPAEGDGEAVLWMELWVHALRDPEVNAARGTAWRSRTSASDWRRLRMRPEGSETNPYGLRRLPVANR